MKKALIYILLASMALCVLTGCNGGPSPIIKPLEVSMGEIINGYYINEDFGFSMKVPDGYYIATEEELATKFNITDLIEEAEDEDDAVEDFTTYLAFFSEATLENMDGNSHIMIAVEDANKYGYSDKDTYLEYMVYDKTTIYESVKDAIVDSGTLSQVWIGSRRFANRMITLTMPDFNVKFDMYAVVKNGYFLTIMIGAYSDEDLAYLQGFLDTITIE